ncbi:hypothetical protein [Streptomyces sp. NPDC001194]|uniref:hypothetical protein n=1 Tax=Streptomyces sp. NPDC001194 TaxID=3364547 RepID=UPI0036ABACC5
MSEQQHSIIDQPATPEACEADRQQAAAQRANAKGHHSADDRGALGAGRLHTHRS